MPDLQEDNRSVSEAAERKIATTRKEKAYLVLICIVTAMIAGVLLLYPNIHTEPVGDAVSEQTETPPPEHAVITKEVEKIVEVEKEVTVETLQQGLNQMGFLMTAEYYFTDLVSYSSIKKLFHTDIALPFTESSYMVSYDGSVFAGMDLAAAQLQKDDQQKTITVQLPNAEIQTVHIDLDSFRLLEERSGLGNPVSVQDFNSSLQELERKARKSAAERGLLDKADENARLILARFIGSLVDLSVYSLTFDG